LYLSPLIEAGNIDEAKAAARVVDPLPGLSANDQPESYSGYITVDEETDSHIFFWFFPATVSNWYFDDVLTQKTFQNVDPSNAPLVIWLQGGPGSSSMLGLFEINGPVSAIYQGSETVATTNPFAWTQLASIIYIDQPVGTGFSHTAGKFVTTQEETADDLYEMLRQWFLLFPEYTSNAFFVFGESYGGTFLCIAARN